MCILSSLLTKKLFCLVLGQTRGHVGDAATDLRASGESRTNISTPREAKAPDR